MCAASPRRLFWRASRLMLGVALTSAGSSCPVWHEQTFAVQHQALMPGCIAAAAMSSLGVMLAVAAWGSQGVDSAWFCHDSCRRRTLRRSRRL